MSKIKLDNAHNKEEENIEDNESKVKLIDNDAEEEENIDKNKTENNKSFKKYISLIGVLIFLVIVIVIFIILKIISDNNDNSDKKDNTSKESVKIRLKNWEFGSSEEISLTPEKISKGEKSENFHKAPEDFYVCTAMGGLSGNENDFYFEMNLKNINITQFDVDWWFRANFDIDNISEHNLILMHINGINYKANVYIDGNLVAKKDKIIGTFIKYSLDITNYLDKSSKKHYIAFEIQRPHIQWYSNYTDLAISFADWNPDAPDSNMGIWQPVDIEIFEKNNLSVSSAFINTKINEENSINLEIILHIKNWEGRKVQNAFSVQLGNFINLNVKDIIFESFEEKQIVLDNETYNDLNIKYDSKKLWWPFQMGNQTLHNLAIKINDYVFTNQIGLRQVESEYDNKSDKRVYKINNKKLLLLGAGWTPDLFLRQSPENYYNHIKYVRDMGLNTIRLEGKSEGEDFYEYCDKLGILLIPGWNSNDAWQNWKYWDKEVNDLADQSVISQIRKLSPHPSVIIFILGSDFAPTNGVDERWRIIFEKEKWPNEILSSASVSTSTIPTGVKMSGPYSWVPPNYFYLKESRNNQFGGAFGFLSEGGPGENPLRYGSIEKVFSKENMEDYEGEYWNYHCGKGSFTDLSKIIKPIKERMGNITNFDDFQRKSSAIVYEGHRAMFEAYECFRYDSTGVIQWMLNNAWPSNIWHLYDYFMVPTPSYFATKKATERIHALYNYEDNYVYITNNYFFDFETNINLDIYVISSDGKNEKKKSHKINNLKSDEIIKIEEIKGHNENNSILHLEYSYKYDDKDILSSNTYFLNQYMDTLNFSESTFYNTKVIDYADMKFMENLEKANLTVEILSKNYFEENGIKKVRYNFEIKNNGNVIALLLELKLYQKYQGNTEIVSPIIWSDNYFSIRAKSSYNIIAEFIHDETKDLTLNIIGWNNEPINQKI